MRYTQAVKKNKVERQVERSGRFERRQAGNVRGLTLSRSGRCERRQACGVSAIQGQARVGWTGRCIEDRGQEV
jgi:hypothetical protein